MRAVFSLAARLFVDFIYLRAITVIINWYGVVSSDRFAVAMLIYDLRNVFCCALSASHYSILYYIIQGAYYDYEGQIPIISWGTN